MSSDDDPCGSIGDGGGPAGPSPHENVFAALNVIDAEQLHLPRRAWDFGADRRGWHSDGEESAEGGGSSDCGARRGNNGCAEEDAGDNFDGAAGGLFEHLPRMTDGIDLPWGGSAQFFSDESQGLNSGGNGTARVVGATRRRRYLTAFAILLSFLVLAMALFLSGGNGEDAASEGQKDAKNREPAHNEDRPENYDFAQYGYGYVRATSHSAGWTSWPQDALEEHDGRTFLLFGADDGVRSPEGCAARCHEEGAPSGAWSPKYKACWCNFLEAGRLCREPCVEESYVDFGMRPIAELKYCEKSVCGAGWYHTAEYCEEDVRFDGEACEGIIGGLRAQGLIETAPEEDGASDSDATATEGASDEAITLSLGPASVVTIRKDDPDGRHGGPGGFAVQKDAMVSYLKFDLATLAGEGAVAKAVLQLRATTPRADATVTVDALPDVGDWDRAVVSWNAPLASEGAFRVGSFSAAPTKDGKAPKLDKDKVDVTSAVDPTTARWVTFAVTTDSEAEVRFARVGGRDGGEATPELAVTLVRGGAGGDAAQEVQEDAPPEEDRPLQEEGGTRDVSDFYPHVHEASSAGWVSWYPALLVDKYVQLGEADGVTSLEDCAAECHRMQAPSGAWNAKRGLCFCVHMAVTDLCWEPCVHDEFVNFASEAIAWLSYCKQSVCGGEEWYHSAEYCNEDVEFDKEACDAKLDPAKGAEEAEATSSTEVPASSENDAASDGNAPDDENAPDETAASQNEAQTAEGPGDSSTYLSEFGYPHIHEASSAGWVSWFPALADGKYFVFDDTNGVASLKDCAAECHLKEAPTGAWNPKHGYCICTLEEVTDLCWEPCVQDEFVNFAAQPIAWLSYCEQSVCQGEWEHSEEYCVEGLKLSDEEKCNGILAQESQEHTHPKKAHPLHNGGKDLQGGDASEEALTEPPTSQQDGDSDEQKSDPA